MVLLSPSCWLKTSVEHNPGHPNQLGVVVTNGGYSDWSTMDFPNDINTVSPSHSAASMTSELHAKRSTGRELLGEERGRGPTAVRSPFEHS